MSEAIALKVPAHRDSFTVAKSYRSADSTNNSHDICPTFSNFITFIMVFNSEPASYRGLHNLCSRNVTSEKATRLQYLPCMDDPIVL